MTHILFLVNERSYLLSELAGSAGDLTQAFNSGRLRELLPEADFLPPGSRVAAFEQGNLVVVTCGHEPGLMKKVTYRPSAETDICPTAPPLGKPYLTPRETGVLQALVRGLSVKQVAHQYGIQPRTVREYLKSIQEKLGAQTIEQAVAKGVILGLCAPVKSDILDGDQE